MNPADKALVENFAAAIQTKPIVADRFDELVLLSDPAKGNFSIVFEARDTVLGKSVILKFLRPDRRDDYNLKCFKREQEIGIALRGHSNIVQCIAPGGTHQIIATLPGGITLPYLFDFIALERGVRDFESYLYAARPRSGALWRRLSVVRDVTKGVSRLHHLGYMHRDIKPDNIFMYPGGDAKLGDLGRCRHLSDPPLLSRYGGPPGHLRYAAPEMFCGGADQADLLPGADWFGVGAILFESVAGVNVYSAIGLENVYNIATLFAALGDISGYLQLIGDVSGAYPVPRLETYAPREVLDRYSQTTLGTIDGLIRSLCHFDFRRREKSANRILRRLDLAIESAHVDDSVRQRQLARAQHSATTVPGEISAH